MKAKAKIPKKKLLKVYDVIYTTKGGGVIRAGGIEATSKAEAMRKLKTQMRASTTLKKVVMAIERY